MIYAFSSCLYVCIILFTKIIYQYGFLYPLIEFVGGGCGMITLIRLKNRFNWLTVKLIRKCFYLYFITLSP